MIGDPAQRPPLRFAVLAVLLVLPALGLAALALRALALDRRAADAEAAARAQDVAVAIAARLTNAIHEARPRVVMASLPRNSPEAPPGGAPCFIVQPDGTLAWPPPGTWPPRPEPPSRLLNDEAAGEWEQGLQAVATCDWSTAEKVMGGFVEQPKRHGAAGGGAWLLAEALFLRALATEQLGDPAFAAERYHEAFQVAVPDARSAAGASSRLLAALAILRLAEGRTEPLPGFWRADPKSLVNDLALVPWTPLNQRVLDELDPHLPALADAAGVTVAALTEPLRRQEIGRRAYAALRVRQTARGEEGFRLRAAMLFFLDGEPWFAIRQRPVIPGAEPAPEPPAGAEQLGHFGLFRWATLFDEAREAARAADPRGVFGFAVTYGSFGYREEPEGLRDRAAATVTAALPQGLAFTVAAAPVEAEAFFAAQRRRERTLGAVVLGAVAVSLVAAAVTWRMLARQHRLGVEKSNLVAAVSHELRAPLASVRLLADNLEQGRVPDDARRGEALRLIGRECRRLGALVDNVLDLARIARGRRRYEFGPTDVAALVRETVASLAPAAAERGVGLRADFAPGAEALEAVVDGRALQQALLNLLDNALKHAPAGSEVTVAVAATPSSPNSGGDAPSPRVSAAARRAREGEAQSSKLKAQNETGDEASPAPCCDEASRPRHGSPHPGPLPRGEGEGRTDVLARAFTITVTDAGPGVPAAERERVFEPFHRMGGELRRETTGVGIGLAIVRHIVAAHGGRVWIEDAEPRGARVGMEIGDKRKAP